MDCSDLGGECQQSKEEDSLMLTSDDNASDSFLQTSPGFGFILFERKGIVITDARLSNKVWNKKQEILNWGMLVK